MPSTLFISFNNVSKYLALVIGFKGYLFNSSKSINDAKVKLCSELYLRFGFATYNWSDVWLTDTHNAVFDGVNFMIKHVLLLIINFVQYI